MADEVRRIKRELVHKGAVLDIYCDTMQFENGNTAKWDFIHHDGAAAVVPVMDDRRYTLELPAGKLDDPKEEGIVCAARELEEETGYRSDKLEWLITLRTTVAFCDERIEIFTAHDLIPTCQDLDEDEYIDVKAYTLDELKKKIFSGEIEDSKTIAAIMAYAVKYNR